MIIIISIITIILFLVLIGCTWHNLDNLEKHMKVIYIIIGLIVMAFITLIIFNISSANINYEKIEIKNDVRIILVLIFTPVNALFVMPEFAKMLKKINNNEIEKSQLLFKIILTLLIFIIVVILEYNYLKSTQIGIIKIYENLK